MIVIRWYRLLRWVGLHLLRPLGFKDRWGFNLGEDLDDWTTMKTFVYLDRLEKAAGFERVRTIGPPPRSRSTTRRVVGWSCPHMSMTASGIVGPPTTTLCDCQMQPIYA